MLAWQPNYRAAAYRVYLIVGLWCGAFCLGGTCYCSEGGVGSVASNFIASSGRLPAKCKWQCRPPARDPYTEMTTCVCGSACTDFEQTVAASGPACTFASNAHYLTTRTTSLTT